VTGRRLGSLLGAALVLGLLTAAAAPAVQPLPAGAQVNNDPAAGIDPSLDVSGLDPANADVVGGALTAGKVAVPWAVFRQQEGGGARDQAFVRSFAGGAWTTRGAGTVGGRSSAAPTFGGSLNFDQGADAEAPAIDFAGAGRTVPWASWYELTTGTGFGAEEIFGARLDEAGDANQGKWIFGGQDRGTAGASVPIPSLNIHTDEDAQDPSVAGGSTTDPGAPRPWVAWQETSTAPVAGKDQVFVERSLGPGMANCDGVTPAGVVVGGHVPAIGGTCWQETGIARAGAGGADPSLNVDPTRSGEGPEIAFAGSGDSVPWVVWQESGSSSAGLLGNGLVFAARAVADGAAIGGFHWEVVGGQSAGVLDTSGADGFGGCAQSSGAEGACSLNDAKAESAADPRIAAGTMSPGAQTVPWVVWDETQGGVRRIFLARLVGSGAGAHFEVANGGEPLSGGTGDATLPEITFSGDTPYVSWRQDVGGGVERAFVGHLTGAADPTFVLDQSDVELSPSAQADVRVPISSSCTATPFDGDGATCQGSAVGTPFFLFTAGSGPRSLFADAFAPAAPLTGAAGAVGESGATLNGSVDPRGAAAEASFEYGTSAAYGATIGAGTVGPADAPTPFAARLSGLPPSTTVHYRSRVDTDFGSFFGPDQTFTTEASPVRPPAAVSLPQPGNLTPAKVSRAKVAGSRVKVGISCPKADAGGCRLAVKLIVTARFRGRHIVGVSARKHGKALRTLLVGSAMATLRADQFKVVQASLNRKGERLLAHHNPLKTRLMVTQQGLGAAISTQTVTFRRSRPRGGVR
jgi:hypothetical protein